MKRKTSGPKDEKNLTLVEHLAELRKRIIYSALLFILAVGFCYSFVKIIVKDIIDLARNVEFVFIAPAELLMSYIKISVIGGLIISAPFLIFQVWLFVIPGLKNKEKRLIFFSLLLGSIFFITGVAFAYFVVVPTMLVFFMGFQMDAIRPMLSFNSYLSFVLSTIFTFGTIFELPILMVLLSRFGILKVSFLKENRKFIILIIFVFAAILTPPDVISQIILAGPMILLAEIGIFLSGLVEKKRENSIMSEE
ncbi:twin-arginine translocase subunit TatC [Anaerosolibacter sp.]|uniref:twin-arginine translocase subunit TatC n=1 Tax=Anaerosolibacter sp. TaxID=1872527 RepID=UPI0039F0D9F6